MQLVINDSEVAFLNEWYDVAFYSFFNKVFVGACSFSTFLFSELCPL